MSKLSAAKNDNLRRFIRLRKSARIRKGDVCVYVGHELGPEIPDCDVGLTVADSGYYGVARKPIALCVKDKKGG